MCESFLQEATLDFCSPPPCSPRPCLLSGTPSLTLWVLETCGALIAVCWVLEPWPAEVRQNKFPSPKASTLELTCPWLWPQQQSKQDPEDTLDFHHLWGSRSRADAQLRISEVLGRGGCENWPDLTKRSRTAHSPQLRVWEWSAWVKVI